MNCHSTIVRTSEQENVSWWAVLKKQNFLLQLRALTDSSKMFFPIYSLWKSLLVTLRPGMLIKGDIYAQIVI